MNAPYSSLISYRIRKILMICSNYDSFILREDGRIESQVYEEYIGLNLSDPPKFTWVRSAAEARSFLDGGGRTDMIICLYNDRDREIFPFAASLKASESGIPVVLLTHSSKEIYRRIASQDTSGIEMMFSWHGNADLILAIVKLFEDRQNAPHDILQGGVQAILLVEDSVRYYSTYLPELYRMVLTQTNELLSDTLNDEQRKGRKHYRPKVLLATCLSEAQELYKKYSRSLVGVISDIGMVEFRGQKPEEELLDAGIRLARMIRADDKYMPVLLQSSQGSMEKEAHCLGAGFVRKYSKTLFIQLSEYIREEFGFGDFIFKGSGDTEYARASNLTELLAALPKVPDKVLLANVSRNKFSKWFLARGLYALGMEFRKVHHSDAAEAREYITGMIGAHLRDSGRGIIAGFEKDSYQRNIQFSRMGNGSLGGKARGLAFLNNLVQRAELRHRWEDLTVSVPRTVVITTDFFDQFIIDNGLQYVIDNPDLSDDDILSEFVASRLPAALVEMLKAYIKTVDRPLAIRSSSKLEDSNFQPFAGIYSTYMIPAVEDRNQMLRQLIKAIKSVYSSVYFALARNYIQTTENLLSEEKMAVVIQDICGTAHGGLFYPMLSGVARSYNFYPVGTEKATDGVMDLAFGLGKTVVDGGNTLRVNPFRPKKILQLSDPSLALRDGQKMMYALDLRPGAFKISRNEGINFAYIPVQDAMAEFDWPQLVVSTFDRGNDRMVPGITANGPRVVTFDHILKYGRLPLAEAIREIVTLCREEIQDEVEIEFALDMVPDGDGKAVLKLLQVRPVAGFVASSDVRFEDVEDGVGQKLIRSSKALGSGWFKDISKIIYVSPSSFDKSETVQLAAEITRINAEMRAAGERYLLVGPGRWGSSDPWLGIPVLWNGISEAAVIVEYSIPEFRVEPSQGTHFFHNITSLGVGYMTCADGEVDFQVLDGLSGASASPVIPSEAKESASPALRVISLPSPLTVYIDGTTGRAVVGLTQLQASDTQ